MKTKLLFLTLLITLCSCSSAQSTPEKSKIYESFSVDFTAISTEEKDIESSAQTYASSLATIINKNNSIVDSLDVVGYSKVFTSKLYQENNFKSLQIGSGSSAGEITFNFIKTFHSIKITAQPYYSTYLDYQDKTTVRISCDSFAQLTVNQEDWKIGSANQETKTAEIVTKEFVFDSNQLLISADPAQRAFIRKLEFTFEAVE